MPKTVWWNVPVWMFSFLKARFTTLRRRLLRSCLRWSVTGFDLTCDCLYIGGSRLAALGFRVYGVHGNSRIVRIEVYRDADQSPSLITEARILGFSESCKDSGCRASSCSFHVWSYRFTRVHPGPEFGREPPGGHWRPIFFLLHFPAYFRKIFRRRW